MSFLCVRDDEGRGKKVGELDFFSAPRGWNCVMTCYFTFSSPLFLCLVLHGECIVNCK